MISWHGKKQLDYWSLPKCNNVSGRDPTGLPLGIQKSDTLDVFIGELCRPLVFKYVKELTVHEEFETYRYD